MNSLYEAFSDLYKSLNDDLLDNLKHYSMHAYSIDLFELIKKYAAITPASDKIFNFIEELKEDNSISCMETYYELIDLMNDETEAENV